MSGGSYDYVQYKLDDIAERLRGRHPDNAAVLALADHFEALGEVMHAIEWADNGYTAWRDNDDKIRALLGPAAILRSAVARAEHVQAALAATLDAARAAEDAP